MTVVCVVGNSGVGKSTLVARLAAVGGFAVALEGHAERPFQALMAADLGRYALANQVDYLLARAEQELAIRKNKGVTLMDGGLEVDFFLFTRHFWHQGYLTTAEYALCQRLYQTLRHLLPPPELILFLDAPVAVSMARHAARGRTLEIAQQADLTALDALLREWLKGVTAVPIHTIAAAGDNYLQEEKLVELAGKIKKLGD